MSTVRVGAPSTPLTHGSTRTLDRSRMPAGVRRRLRRLAGVRVGRLLVTLLLPLSAFAWLSGQKTVSLAVDGRTTQVQTHADTVAELLHRNGIGAAAVRVTGSPMTPAPRTLLSDGMVVELYDVAAVDRRATAGSAVADPEGGTAGSGEGKEPSDARRGGLAGALLPDRSEDSNDDDSASDSESEDAPEDAAESEDAPEDAAEFEDAEEAEDAEQSEDRDSENEEADPEELSSEALAKPANLQRGKASWYVYGNGYTAAHRTLPKGTLVKVTNVANGESVQVRINDRGPFIKGRVIDLNRVAFKDIASVNQGVIDVLVTW